jgi:hypothetical protein
MPIPVLIFNQQSKINNQESTISNPSRNPRRGLTPGVDWAGWMEPKAAPVKAFQPVRPNGWGLCDYARIPFRNLVI